MPAIGRPRRDTRPHENLARAVVRVLAQARREAGLSRRQLAETSGVSANTIIKIERADTTDPAFTVVLRLAEALGLGVDGLINRARDIAHMAPALPVSPPGRSGVVHGSARTGAPESKP